MALCKKLIKYPSGFVWTWPNLPRLEGHSNMKCEIGHYQPNSGCALAQIRQIDPELDQADTIRGGQMLASLDRVRPIVTKFGELLATFGRGSIKLEQC